MRNFSKSAAFVAGGFLMAVAANGIAEDKNSANETNLDRAAVAAEIAPPANSKSGENFSGTAFDAASVGVDEDNLEDPADETEVEEIGGETNSDEPETDAAEDLF